MNPLEVKKVTKVEAMNYLRPALRKLLDLKVGYSVDGWIITIKIPKYIPLTKEEKKEADKKLLDY